MKLTIFTISSTLILFPTVAGAVTDEVPNAAIYTQAAASSSVNNVQQYAETFGPGIIGAETFDDRAFAIASSRFEPNPSPLSSLINLQTYAKGYVINHGDLGDEHVSTFAAAYSSVTYYMEIFDRSTANVSLTNVSLHAEIKEIFSGIDLTNFFPGGATWSFLILPLDGIADPIINDSARNTSSIDVKYDSTLTFSTNTLYQVETTLFFDSESGLDSGFSEISGFFDPTFALVTPDPDLELVQSRALVATPVPEPSSWVMMLMGFAGLGFLGYQSRQTRIAPGIASAST
jgi:hypothetical protein